MKSPGDSVPVMRDELRKAISAGDKPQGISLAQAALDAGMTPLAFMNEVVEPVLKPIGDQFSRLEVFLPELMMAGMVVKAIQEEVLAPRIKETKASIERASTVVIGTSYGDIHDIGKNMVALMLQVNGFNVIDLGTSVSSGAFIECAKRENADIIAMSSLLTPSLPYMSDVVERLTAYGLRDRFMLMAGGAAVTRQWAEDAGMDGFGEDAVEAVDISRQLMAMRKERQS